MANIVNNKLECLMLLLLTFSYVLSDRFVDGRKIGTSKLVKPKGTIKTIEGKDGEIIDCVDLYQQPAFDHPLLKNHTIQTEPSSIPSDLKANSSPVKLIQGWHKNGQCPEATIPILRAPKNQHLPALRHFKRSRTQHNNQSLDSDDGDNLSDHEYAVAYFGGSGTYLGSHATINVWKPTVANNGEMSIGQIWLVNGPEQEINTLEAGWRVDFDQKSKFFIYWTVSLLISFQDKI
ncbi:protein neprosin-like [Quercus suber]|uniref:protein neprosin-like n=1 Tax=Quercus suber TaxID=58331 RepID=UPI0032E01A1A